MSGSVKVGLYLSNYAIKSDLKNVSGVDITTFAKKVDIVRLKSEIDKLDIGKLETTPADISKVNDVVKNEVLKNTEYDKLVKNVNAVQTTDTSNLVKKLTMTQKLVKLKRKYLIMIILNLLLLKNLISWREIIL